MRLRSFTIGIFSVVSAAMLFSCSSGVARADWSNWQESDLTYVRSEADEAEGDHLQCFLTINENDIEATVTSWGDSSSEYGCYGVAHSVGTWTQSFIYSPGSPGEAAPTSFHIDVSGIASGDAEGDAYTHYLDDGNEPDVAGVVSLLSDATAGPAGGSIDPETEPPILSFNVGADENRLVNADNDDPYSYTASTSFAAEANAQADATSTEPDAEPYFEFRFNFLVEAKSELIVGSVGP